LRRSASNLFVEGLRARTTNSYAHHRPIPPWTAWTGRWDIARGHTYSRLGWGPGGITDLHAARPTQGAHHCCEVPQKDDTTATFSLQLERAKWAEIFFRLMDGILNMGLAVGQLPHSGASRFLLSAFFCCLLQRLPLDQYFCCSMATPLLTLSVILSNEQGVQNSAAARDLRPDCSATTAGISRISRQTGSRRKSGKVWACLG
jgi:hypothetical protein